MKLFYFPGSCALGPHIALEYSGLPYEAVRIETGRQTDPSYLAVNPLGRVPALVTSAHGIITEAPVVLSYIADIALGAELTESSLRAVPIHPELVRIGFLQFVDHVRANGGTSARLFPKLTPGPKGGFGEAFSKWFGRYKRELGILVMARPDIARTATRTFSPRQPDRISADQRKARLIRRAAMQIGLDLQMHAAAEARAVVLNPDPGAATPRTILQCGP